MTSPRLTKKRLQQLEKDVFQYEVTLTKILPREIAHENDTLTEEVGILLFQRDCLEKDLQLYGVRDELAPIRQRVRELDNTLIGQRWMILDHARDYYEYERERLKMPRECWWWYLDEVEATQVPEREMAASGVT